MAARLVSAPALPVPSPRQFLYSTRKKHVRTCESAALLQTLSIIWRWRCRRRLFAFVPVFAFIPFEETTVSQGLHDLPSTTSLPRRTRGVAARAHSQALAARLLRGKAAVKPSDAAAV
eukprot:6201900-Pleurochrysis_carterae.AAC.3